MARLRCFALAVGAAGCTGVIGASGEPGPDGGGPSDDSGPTDAPSADAPGPDVEVPPYDCDDLPPGPLAMTLVDGAVASEDLAFDDEGHLVGLYGTDIYKTEYDGTREVFVPNISFRAGMRYLPNGHLVIAKDSEGSLVRIEPDGTQFVVLSGLAYPNGLEVGLDGYVYLTEHDGPRVWRIDPMTGEYTILVDGAFASPNGITFNREYDMLYIGSFAGAGIFTLPVDEEGNPGELELFAQVGTGALDGLGVDACGNVYVCDYGASLVYRLSPDGSSQEVLIDNSATFTYLPNFQWGSGIGGWRTAALYFPEGWMQQVFEVDVGVPAKPRAFP